MEQPSLQRLLSSSSVVVSVGKAIDLGSRLPGRCVGLLDDGAHSALALELDLRQGRSCKQERRASKSP